MKMNQQVKTETKALVIEDEGQISLILNILLEGMGIECDHVKNISDARHYIASNHPGLIILDNKLPDGFGIDMISSLKSSHPGTGIIMMSGYTSSKDEALKLGADIFLEKPFTMDEIYDAVHSLVPYSSDLQFTAAKQ
jgi:DNA-binding response OmpR family regulator